MTADEQMKALGIDPTMVPLILASLIGGYFLARPSAVQANNTNPIQAPNANGLDFKEMIVTAYNYQVDIMARTAWAEARGFKEDDPRTPLHDGMQAVINVIMNRYKLAIRRAGGAWWGNTPADICFKKRGKYYQFECWSPTAEVLGRLRTVNRSDPEFVKAWALAEAGWKGTLPDITRGATHYYNPNKVRPDWVLVLPLTARVANHDFHFEALA